MPKKKPSPKKQISITKRLAEINANCNQSNQIQFRVMSDIYSQISDFKDIDNIEYLIQQTSVIDLSYQIEKASSKKDNDNEITQLYNEMEEQLKYLETIAIIYSHVYNASKYIKFAPFIKTVVKDNSNDLTILANTLKDTLQDTANFAVSAGVDIHESLAPQRVRMAKAKAKDLWTLYNALRDPDDTGKKTKGKGFTVPQAMQIVLANAGKGGNSANVMGAIQQGVSSVIQQGVSSAAQQSFLNDSNFQE